MSEHEKKPASRIFIDAFVRLATSTHIAPWLKSTKRSIESSQVWTKKIGGALWDCLHSNGDAAASRD